MRTSRKSVRRKKLSSKMNISEKTYQKLLSMKKNNKRLSSYQKKSLERALHYKYCDCIKQVKYTQKNQLAYGICAKSVYLNRDFVMPKKAAQKCSKYTKNLNRNNKKKNVKDIEEVNE